MNARTASRRALKLPTSGFGETLAGSSDKDDQASTFTPRTRLTAAARSL